MKNETFQNLIKLTNKYNSILIITIILITLFFIVIFYYTYRIQDYYNPYNPNSKYYLSPNFLKYNKQQAGLIYNFIIMFRVILFFSYCIISIIILIIIEKKFQDKFKTLLIPFVLKNLNNNNYWAIKYESDIKSYDKNYYENLNNVINLGIKNVFKLINNDFIEKYNNKEKLKEIINLEDLIIINSIFHIIDFSFGYYKGNLRNLRVKKTDIGSEEVILYFPMFKGFILDFPLYILNFNIASNEIDLKDEIIKDFESVCYFDNKLKKINISYMVSSKYTMDFIKPYLDYLQRKYYHQKELYNSFFIIKYNRVWNFISFKDLNYRSYGELFPVPSLPTFITKEKIQKIYEVYQEQILKLIEFLTN
jgi:hypothetical protein